MRSTRSSEAGSGLPESSATDTHAQPADLRVGIIDLMPISAGGAAAKMFSTLLGRASSTSPVISCRTRLLVRGRRPDGIPLIDLEVLAHLDLVVVTGTEPQGHCLARDPVAGLVSRIVNDARSTVRSTFFSCFSAHAALSSVRPVTRHPLAVKHSGVFPHVICDPHHRLTAGLDRRIVVPHSRWNTVDQRFLAANGISPVIVEESGQWHIATSDDGISRIYSQGHPEYLPDTLYREFRRDARRFVHGETGSFPTIPEGYVGERLRRQLETFRDQAERDPRKASTLPFPAFEHGDVLRCWTGSSVRFMRNWLEAVDSLVRS